MRAPNEGPATPPIDVGGFSASPEDAPTNHYIYFLVWSIYLQPRAQISPPALCQISHLRSLLPAAQNPESGIRKELLPDSGKRHLRFSLFKRKQKAATLLSREVGGFPRW